MPECPACLEKVENVFQCEKCPHSLCSFCINPHALLTHEKISEEDKITGVFAMTLPKSEKYLTLLVVQWVAVRNGYLDYAIKILEEAKKYKETKVPEVFLEAFKDD